MELVENEDPNKCLLRVTKEEQDALTNATSEGEHQELLGRGVLSHLKKHHNYGSTDPEKAPINLQHQVVG